MTDEKIILEEHLNGGFISVDIKDLTPEFIESIKKDKEDKMGWKKYRKLMKEKGYDIE